MNKSGLLLGLVGALPGLFQERPPPSGGARRRSPPREQEHSWTEIAQLLTYRQPPQHADTGTLMITLSRITHIMPISGRRCIAAFVDRGGVATPLLAESIIPTRPEMTALTRQWRGRSIQWRLPAQWTLC